VRWRLLASARGRILGWSVLLLAAGIAASTVATRVLLVQGMNAQVRGELAHEVGEFKALAARRSSAAGRRAPGQVVALLRIRTQQAVLEHDTVLIGLVGTRVVATSRNFSPATLGASAGLRASWAARGQQVDGVANLAIGPIRYTVVPARVPGDPVRGTFVAAVLLGPGEASIGRVTQLQLETGGIALLAGTALAWLIAGRVLRPVRDTTELARQITDTDIAGRIPVRGHNEITELANTFNRMLDRLEAALTTQRRFLADAGHELRTPITIVQGNLDTLEPASQEDAETLAIAADELARMSRLVDELTVLASSERPDFLRCQPIDIRSLTSSVLAKARLLGDRPWLLTGAATGTAVLDPQRLTQALMQLAANAAAHTPPGTAVEISSGLRGGMLEFTVADHGPGIPASERGRIFERFARLHTPRTDGTGLGLSIVAAITAAHGGTVQVTDAPGGGAAFVVALPLGMAGPAPVQDHLVAAARTLAEKGALP
jgi:two-component system, OmpR family, sensor kinase